jgi:hypothetical protein
MVIKRPSFDFQEAAIVSKMHVGSWCLFRPDLLLSKSGLELPPPFPNLLGSMPRYIKWTDEIILNYTRNSFAITSLSTLN